MITCNSSHSIFIMKSVKFVERSKEMKNIETYSHSYYDHWNSKGNIFSDLRHLRQGGIIFWPQKNYLPKWPQKCPKVS